MMMHNIFSAISFFFWRYSGRPQPSPTLEHAEIINDPPNPGGGTAPPGADALLKILSWVAWGAVACAVTGVIITGAMMAISHRRGDDAQVGRLGWVLFGCFLIGGASGIVKALLP